MFAIFPLIKRWLVGLLTVVIAIALISCNPNDFKSQAAQVTQIVARTPGDPQSFNYALNQSSPSVFGFIYEGLTVENGNTGAIEPGIAQS